MFNSIKKSLAVVSIALTTITIACKVPSMSVDGQPQTPPASFASSLDTVTSANVSWQQFFKDPYLASLIDTALIQNQELLITLQEIEIARSEIRERNSVLSPSVTLGGGMGVEKVGRYTSQGAGDASTDIKPGKEMPDPLPDFRGAAMASWEPDIWKKLRTAKKAAVTRYLATIEGQHFVKTNLVAEIARSYYELLALDNQLSVVQQNIRLQQDALEVVKVQKQAARATELGVQKFQAEVLSSQSLEFEIRQQINETENRINLLLGRYPQPIARASGDFLQVTLPMVQSGIPSQLLINRPDIRQAELMLAAAKMDVKVARAEFYPTLEIGAGIGVQAFNPTYLVKMPASLLYSIAGELAGPLINRQAIKAAFNRASAEQVQALYAYDRTILSAYLEIATQLSNISNLQKNYAMKLQQVAALGRSIDIANDLFKSARADYFEVLMTQRDALEAKLELIETKKQQLNSVVSIYHDLGGGWK